MQFRKIKARLYECQETQGTLANHLCISQNSVSKKMNGERDWTWSEMDRICKFLSIPENEIGLYFFTKELRKT